MKTSELTGAALDWAVAKCWYGDDYDLSIPLFDDGLIFAPSTNWAHGGQIIEREGILLRPLRNPGHSLDGLWLAMYDGTNTGTIVQWVKRTDWHRHYLDGPSPLVASMRCYVASKLGNEVDIPAELTA